MIAIGRYLLFIISVTEMTLSDDDVFSEERMTLSYDDPLSEESEFLDYIFNLHNAARTKHGVQPLKRTDDLDEIASEILVSMFNNTQYPGNYGTNCSSRLYDINIRLNVEEANTIFSEWYDKEEYYNYCFEPSNNDADEFTQIVWKDTKKLGIALKWANDYYLVQVVYDPRGNVPGQFKANVLQPPIIGQARNSVNNLLIYRRDSERFLDYILYLHNAARTKHGVPLLERNDELNELATNILHMMSRGKNKRSELYGMNSHVRMYDDNTKLDATEAEAIFSEWYNKGEKYNYRVAPSNNDVDEFTQIVWKATKTVGIAMRREERFYAVVVLYNPPGNIQGEFENNVVGRQSMDQRESSVNN